MKWVTREKAKVDRIACPWLITHFVDPNAQFLFVPKDKVQEVARAEGAIPFDAPDVELTHYLEDGKEFVSFDAIMRKYKLNDPALRELAKIVRGADAKEREPVPESGLRSRSNWVQRNLPRRFREHETAISSIRRALQALSTNVTP